MQNARLQSVVVFDGDDTLWRTMPLYTEAKARFFALMDRASLNSEGIEREFEERDHRNVAKWGFTVERFRNSMVETYRARALAAGVSPELKREEEISRIATSVARRRAPLLPYARQVLTRLSASCRLVLLTKGEYELQRRRVMASGLEGLFEKVIIVDHKDVATFRQLATELKVKPDRVWSVGDSMRSDVRPALAAGFRAVWIPQKTWSYEEVDSDLDAPGRFLRPRSIRELPKVLLPELRKDGE
ncbi:MAG: HAD family hydrolase [Bryobacterales bacterium]|nr:HAD family hydrolase [Bryobacterales bacterium]